MPLLLLSIGGDNIKSVAAGEATKSLNNTMTSAATVVGAIVILVAIVKLIMALAEQNAATKQQASLMFAVGIFFLSMSTIIKMLGIDGTTVPETKTVAENIINIIAKVLTYSGGILILMAIIMLIMSIASEQAEQKQEATKLLGVGIGLLSTSALATTIIRVFVKGNTKSSVAGTTAVHIVASFIATIATYMGGGFALMGIWYIVNGIRSEDPKDRDTGIRFLITGIALLSAKAVFTLFGFNANVAIGE